MTRPGLLLDERLVCAHPSLVRALGLTKAVVLQQINWNITTAGNGRKLDGHAWYPVTAAALAAQIGLSDVTMRRVLVALEEDGVLVSCQPEGRASRRKWYRIERDSDAIRLIASEPINLIASDQLNLIASSSSQQVKQERGASAPASALFAEEREPEHAPDSDGDTGSGGSAVRDLLAGWIDDVTDKCGGTAPPSLAAWKPPTIKAITKALAQGWSYEQIEVGLYVCAAEVKKPWTALENVMNDELTGKVRKGLPQ